MTRNKAGGRQTVNFGFALIFLLAFVNVERTDAGVWNTLQSDSSERADFAYTYSSSTNTLIVFGGLSGSYPGTPVSSLSKYSVGSDTWSHPSVTGAPSARTFMTAVRTSSGDFLFFGGFEEPSTRHNDLYLYDESSNTFTPLNPSGTLPTGRSQHSAVITPTDTMIIFGGATPQDTNEVWKYDYNINTWTRLQDRDTSVTKPAPRFDHQAVWTSDNTMLVFGGYSPTQGQYLSDLWKYDPSYNTWTQITASGGPSGRASFGAALSYDNSFLIWGGTDGTVTPPNNFYSYSASGSWASVSQSGATPSARRGVGAVYVSSSNKMLMFGGLTVPSTLYSDLRENVLASRHSVQLYYGIESLPSGSFIYTFRLLAIDDGALNINDFVIADNGTSAPTGAQGLSSPAAVQLPDGFPMDIVTGASHGPRFINGSGWTPSGVGSSLVFKISATNKISAGKLYWKASFMTSPTLAISNCRLADLNSDKDADGFSYCDDFDLNYYDCDDNNDTISPGALELCNQIDDNCNRVIDTDITVFEPLPLQNGTCLGYNQTCIAGIWVSNYTKVPGYHNPEGLFCNGLDDDCDGIVDNNLTPPNATKQNGVCQGALKACNGTGGFIEPNYADIPSYQVLETLCDGLDNDCDRKIDFNLTGNFTTLQSGVCDGLRQQCINGSWLELYSSQANYSTFELCDGLDNNCDGVVDNNISSLLAPVSSKNTGVCLGVLKVCNGSWIDPNFTNILDYEPTETICDGLDNDCDGSVDENIFDTQLNDNQKGVCNGTYQKCINGTFMDYYGADAIVNYNETEGLLCDGLDNDCNGLVDDALFWKAAVKQLGVCAGAGQVCMGFQGWREPNYTALFPTYQAIESICDLLDNDCNGVVDQLETTLTTRQGGPCHGLFQKCLNGSGFDDYSSVANFEYNETSCDGIDNDCDFIVDNVITIGNLTGIQQGVCFGATQTCFNGTWFDDYYVIPGYQLNETLCDGLDNDCDGSEDEDLVPPLVTANRGVCLGWTKVCHGALGWQDDLFRIGNYSETEVCDKLDNDCNGAIDEGLIGNLTSNQLGVCSNSRFECINGQWRESYLASLRYQPSPETICDGLDNDCNGADDDIDPQFVPLSDNQNGACNGSKQICSHSETGFYNPPLANITGYGVEECNGRDDNCDGIVDNVPSGACVFTTGSATQSSSSNPTGGANGGGSLLPGIGSSETITIGNATYNLSSFIIVVVVIGAVLLACIGAASFICKKKRKGKISFPMMINGTAWPPGYYDEDGIWRTENGVELDPMGMDVETDTNDPSVEAYRAQFLFYWQRYKTYVQQEEFKRDKKINKHSSSLPPMMDSNPPY